MAASCRLCSVSSSSAARSSAAGDGVAVNLPPHLEQRIREWVVAGMSDEDISAATFVSVKVIRLIRREAEAAFRPR